MNATKSETKSETYAGFRQVDQEEFFKFVNPLNITPYPSTRWSEEIGYVVEWKTQMGAVLALSDGSESCKVKDRWFLKA